MKVTERHRIYEPPDEWGGRAAVAWAKRLAEDKSFDPEAWNGVRVAEVIDIIYQR